MKPEVRQSGRNCSFFPIARGRFDSQLRMKVEGNGLTFFMPSSFHIGNIFWRLFFIYIFLGIIAFVTLTLGINNGNWNIVPFFEHPQRNTYLIAAGAILIFPYIFIMILAFLKPVPRLFINQEDKTITAGMYRRGFWKSVSYQYSFFDLGAIEVLRNYEHFGQGYIGRPAGNDSYELNLYFHSDNSWLGISESTRRQKILGQADLISRITGVPYKENNVSDNVDSVLTGGVQPDQTEIQNPVRAEYAALNNLPPFILDRIGTPVHKIEVIQSKLKRKATPFNIKLSDEFGQKFLSLIMPVISHMVNKIEYSKSLAALEFLCSDRSDDSITREKKISELKNAGWRDEKELITVLSLLYDAQTGPIPGLTVNRDYFERYYMTLKDSIKIPSVKYRIIFFEYLETVIDESSERISTYEKNPEALKEIQNSENYALRFIIDLVFIIFIVISGFSFVGLLLSDFNFTSPMLIIRKLFSAGITVGLIYFWRRIRKKTGHKSNFRK